MLKTKLILYGIVSLFCTNLSAQRGFITYTFESPVYKFRNGLATERQNAVLHFNQHESLFIYDKIGMDSIQQGPSIRFTQKGENAGAHISASHIDKEGFQVYRNFKTKSISFRITKVKPFEPYIVEDEWLEIDWEIQDEYKIISGLKCQKAKGKFRGRTYFVWFSKEIPLPYGPWKLFGLPGLIIEAQTKNGKFKAIFKNLCFPCLASQYEIKKPQEKKQKTLKEHVYFVDHIFKNVLKEMRAHIPKGSGIKINLNNPRNKKDIIKFRETNRLEKQYEWEDYPGDTPNPFAEEEKETSKSLETAPQTIPIESERN